ncbi:GDP-L-fucose synthase family protein [Reyranella sp.]|uniref:GDP-L-fucose synthase family protein n=1 Tax=Reyranella sp. TaxID=1929291 RepID=UPI003D0C6415
MVGAAIVRRLGRAGCDILTVGREQVDLTRQAEVERWLDQARPDAVIMAAARVGGIHANSTLPADFLFVNLMIGANVVNAAHAAGVKRLVNLGSSCMYPVGASQPISEASIGDGRPEPTNEAYAVAKLATASLAASYRKQFGADYVTVIPTNLYGPGDNFDPMMSHVAPALMRRMIEARDAGAPRVEIWGSGKPRRELMFVDDAADAIVFVLENYSAAEPINVGIGVDVSIRELAELVAKVVGYRGELAFDASKPDGAPRRLLDNGRLADLGWRARTPLADGLDEMYRWYCKQKVDVAA